MKKVVAAVLLLIAILLGYTFAVLNFPEATGGEAGFGAKLVAPIKDIDGAGVGVLLLGALCLLGAVYFVFAKSGAAKAAATSSGKLTGKYSYLGRKSKGLEAGFLLNGLLAFAVLVVMVQGTINGWLNNAALGALGAAFVLQILAGFLFFVLFAKKRDKAILPFLPAMALFLFEIVVGGFALVAGLKP